MNELYTDGGARPTNPGPAGYACFLYDAAGALIDYKSGAIGWHTNNFAEYMGLVHGIKLAVEHKHGSNGLVIYTDSKLVWGHMTQGWKRNIDELKMLIRDAEKLLHAHYENDQTGERHWQMEWIPRERNCDADAACTTAINKARKRDPNPFSVKAGIR